LFLFVSPAATDIPSQKDADCRSKSHPNSESDAERAEWVLFDSTFRVVNQVFRRAAALFHSAPCRDDAIVDGIGDGFLHAFDLGSQLITDFYGFFEHLGLHCSYLPD
jgi:hypothetical protein